MTNTTKLLVMVSEKPINLPLHELVTKTSSRVATQVVNGVEITEIWECEDESKREVQKNILWNSGVTSVNIDSDEDEIQLLKQMEIFHSL